ncbi:MAG: hypothetical protein AB2693_31930 [Candidatus Thiodiazotropha sp.]
MDIPDTQAELEVPEVDEDIFDPGFDREIAALPLSLCQNVAEVELHVLPETFNIEEELKRMTYSTPLNDVQININSVLSELLKNKETVTKLANVMYSHFMDLYNKSVSENAGKVSQPELNVFFQQSHHYMTSDTFQSQADMLKNLLSTFSKDAIESVFFKLSTICRQLVLSVKSSALPVSGPRFLHNRTSSQLEGSAAARGKVRYIGGYVVASLLYKYNCQVKSSLFKTGTDSNEKYEFSLRMVDTLETFKVSEHLLSETTTDPDSLQQISRRQNISRGLTNICDPVYLFFEHLVCRIIQELTVENFNKSDSLSGHLMSTLMESSDLFEELSSLVPLSHQAVKVILFERIIEKVAAILLKQFSKDIISALNIEKKMEHRKQIKVKKPASKRKPIDQPGTSGHSNTINKQTKKAVPEKKAVATPDSDSSSESSEEDNFCFKCGGEYAENEDWIACDICQHWFHRRCCGLSSAKQWNYYKPKHRRFSCPDCK